MLDFSKLLRDISPLQDLDNPDEEKCKGTFYRYRKSVYKTKRGFAVTETITKLKRMSCKGCNWCSGTDEMIHDEMDNAGEFPIILPSSIVDGDIIEPYIVDGPRDWETGYPDTWEIHAKIVKRNK